MSSSLYEIIELTNGDVALRRVDAEEGSEPLVAIKFSEESLFFLGEAKLEIAKAMIEAGLDTVSDIVDSAELDDKDSNDSVDTDDDVGDDASVILH